MRALVVSGRPAPEFVETGRLHTFGGGHFYLDEQPAEVARAITRSVS
ncbi:hypothetical protein [Nocardia lasii]|uniref:Alpha/beta hydrolase n=1 Tax=Nocardia lasii TaxID=1616107 RepID=A0ABW1JNG0_9NOCA